MSARAMLLACVVTVGCATPAGEGAASPEQAPASPQAASQAQTDDPPACLGLGPSDGCADDQPGSMSTLADADTLDVRGGPLQPCSTDPVTGWFRDGFCRTDARDRGLHTVCAEVDAEFLQYTAGRGNDLSTPAPSVGFPGLQPGDRWCLCAARWLEAERAGKAPRVVMHASDDAALKVVDAQTLERYAVEQTSARR